MRRSGIFVALAAVAAMTVATVSATPALASTHRTHPPASARSTTSPGHPKGHAPRPGRFHQVATVSYPAPYTAPKSFDISWVDQQTHTYYLSDRINNGVDAIDGRTDTFAGLIGHGDFAGDGSAATSAQKATCGTGGTAGPDGELTLTIDGHTQLWAGNGVDATSPTSSVKVFDLTNPTTGTLAASISTGGSCRADEMSYDAKDHLVLIANDADSPAYVSLISVNVDAAKDRVVKKIPVTDAIDGIEQSAWDAVTDRFLVNIPQVPTKNGDWQGEVLTVNPRTMRVEKAFPVSGCSPAGLALDARAGQMLLGCSADAIAGGTVDGVAYHANPVVSVVMNSRNGRVIARIPQVGGSDEVWLDPTDHTYYLGANHMTSNGLITGYPTPSVGMISATAHPRFLGNFPTTAGDHSLAADAATGKVFVPISGYGVAVFTGR